MLLLMVFATFIGKPCADKKRLVSESWNNTIKSWTCLFVNSSLTWYLITKVDHLNIPDIIDDLNVNINKPINSSSWQKYAQHSKENL